MGLSERYHENATREAGRRTDGEPVLLAAFANRVGSMDAALITHVGGFGINAPRGEIQREGGKSTRLPLNFIIAVTPTRMFVFSHKLFWGRVKIKAQLGVFDRAELEVETADRSMTKQFLVASRSPRQTIAFEMTQKQAFGPLTKHARADQMEALLRQPVEPPERRVDRAIDDFSSL